MEKRFPWGQIIDTFTYNFDGEELEVTKFHPWILSNGSSHNIRGKPSDRVEYHSEEMHQSCRSILELVIHWIAYKRLGDNNFSLADGVCRAFEISNEEIKQKQKPI